MTKLSWDQPGVRRAALLALSLLSIALLVHEIFGEHGYLALRRQKKEVEALEQQIQKLQEENQKLEEQVKALKSDPKAIEKLAREEMKLARPGEIIYVLPEKKQASNGQVLGTGKEGTGNREQGTEIKKR